MVRVARLVRASTLCRAGLSPVLLPLYPVTRLRGARSPSPVFINISYPTVSTVSTPPPPPKKTDKCVNTGIVIENNLIGGIELTNCRKMRIQMKGNAPQIVCDGTFESTFYCMPIEGDERNFPTIVSSNATDNKIYTPNPSPGEDDDDMFLEMIPFQFVSTFKDGKWSTAPAESHGD